MKWLLVIGNPMDGLIFRGTFDSKYDAVEWASKNLNGQDWWVAEIHNP